jgi:hypothetical protein
LFVLRFIHAIINIIALMFRKKLSSEDDF